MTVLTANGSGTGRWFRLKKLARSIGQPKRGTKSEQRGDAYSDYWKVRNHRAPGAAENSKK